MAAFHPQTAATMSRPAAHVLPVASGNGPVGTFAPGTKVTVGSHRVVVERYLSEGGFAHVYVVRVPLAGGGTETAVLKRVAVPDKEALANMRTEVETMKKLKGHRKIVTYFDSHASQLKGGGYEVFLLMEFCDGGGLIDFMNTRLKNRLTEPEILKIFCDTAEGVACMHYLKPPLLHRDLKVENILISGKNSSLVYKLCDFGSTAPPRPAATSVAEGRLIEDDVQRHTTLQYRSPEMIDVYRKRPIDEKSDIWALGVLLYKLCYYTTPFEEQGQMAILTASFKYPGYPRFSDRLKALIASMLTADPQKRPTIYQVLKEACAMRGKEVPVKDIYATRTQSEARSNQRLPSPEPNVKSPTIVGISKAPIEETRSTVPDITPMRRGRPLSSSQTTSSAKPASSMEKKERDPFAALDSPSYATRSAAVDQLASRFPPAEQFALLQDRKPNFDFNGPAKNSETLKSRITNALADEAFATSKTGAPTAQASTNAPASGVARSTSLRTSKAPLVTVSRSLPNKTIQKPVVDLPKMVSTGTMTSPSSSVDADKKNQISITTRPIWRVPTPRSDSPQLLEPFPPKRPADQYAMRERRDSSLPPRHSMDEERPPMLDMSRAIHRSRSADEPSLSPSKSDRFESNMDKTLHHGHERRRSANVRDVSSSTGATDEVFSDLDYLRQVEKEDANRHHHGHLHHRHASSTASRPKNLSFPLLAPHGTRHALAGTIHSARRLFEGGAGHHSQSHSPSEGNRQSNTRNPEDFALSRAEESAIDETEDLSPEMRRELERRRLSMEEKRVADAAAAYRSSLAHGSKAAAPRAKALEIQNRVKSLLDESGRTSPLKKTAAGYGRYTDSGGLSTRPREAAAPRAQQRPLNDTLPPQSSGAPSEFAPAALKSERPTGRPNAPPKPVALRTGSTLLANSREQATSGGEVDLESDFNKRYPDLSFDMVETEIVGAQQVSARSNGLRIKDV